jgi:hypothetical protein
MKNACSYIIKVVRSQRMRCMSYDTKEDNIKTVVVVYPGLNRLRTWFSGEFF